MRVGTRCRWRVTFSLAGDRTSQLFSTLRSHCRTAHTAQSLCARAYRLNTESRAAARHGRARRDSAQRYSTAASADPHTMCVACCSTEIGEVYTHRRSASSYLGLLIAIVPTRISTRTRTCLAHHGRALRVSAPVRVGSPDLHLRPGRPLPALDGPHVLIHDQLLGRVASTTTNLEFQTSPHRALQSVDSVR